jgi:hypothetical protein
MLNWALSLKGLRDRSVTETAAVRPVSDHLYYPILPPDPQLELLKSSILKDKNFISINKYFLQHSLYCAEQLQSGMAFFPV